MVSLSARLPARLAIGRHGSTGMAAGSRLRLVPQRQIVSIIARRDGVDLLQSVTRREFGVDLPDRSLLVRGDGASFLWGGYQQWFAMADEGTDDLVVRLRQRAGASASLSDQSDSRLIVELSGPVVRAILAKLLPIDLHPSAFVSGVTALTVLEHVGCQITQTGDEPTYELMAFRSFAESILDAIVTAGAEFGIDVVV